MFYIYAWNGFIFPSFSNGTSCSPSCYDTGTWNIAFQGTDGDRESTPQAICEGNLVATGTIKATSLNPYDTAEPITVYLMKEQRGIDPVIKVREVEVDVNGRPSSFRINAGDVELGNYYIEVVEGESPKSVQYSGYGDFYLE
ncbi:hypothetical protein VSK91_03830 [Bacillus swezeyi]|uniref:hypothetical protein n=1 Tax=Bacillus swezeyi TaxID=1925020 RepID=UPI0039C5BC6B